MELVRSVCEYVAAFFATKLGVTRADAVSCLVILSLVAIVMLPDVVFAQTSVAGTGDTAVSKAVCKVVKQLTGPVGRAVAAVAIIFLGFSLFLGKVSWGLAIAVGMGIAAIFGAETIVSFFDTEGTISGKCTSQ